MYGCFCAIYYWPYFVLQTYQHIGLKIEEKLVKCYIWSIALYGAETGTLRAVDQKHVESFELWCWSTVPSTFH